MSLEKDNLKLKFLEEENKRQPQKGGFFPLEPFPSGKKKELPKSCPDKDHEPPMFLHIPQGQGYRHVCPTCGTVKVIIPPQITMQNQ